MTKLIIAALVAMNFALLGYLFYSGSPQVVAQRDDKMMASCVSANISRLVLEAMQGSPESYYDPDEPPLPTVQPRSIER